MTKTELYVLEEKAKAIHGNLTIHPATILKLIDELKELKRERQWLAEKLAEWCRKDMYAFCPVDECRHLASCFENTVDYILKMAREATK